MDFTKDELDEWLHHPVTVSMFQNLKAQRTGVVEEILNGTTLSDNAGHTAQLTARAVGEVAGLDFVINKDFIENDD